MKLLYFSGNTLLIFQALVGITTSLSCIRCSWNPANNTDDCVSKPFDQPTEECDISDNNHVLLCETKATFKVVGKTYYVESVIRECARKHYHCNKLCKPLERKICHLCCNEGDHCNSFPLASNVLPISMYYNVTSAAAQTDTPARASLVLFLELIFTFFMFFV